MTSPCLAEVMYGDGYRVSTNADGTQSITYGIKTFQKWDNKWIPVSTANISSGEWPYALLEDDEKYVLFRNEDSLILQKTFAQYNFGFNEISLNFTVTPAQLATRSTANGVNWQIDLPDAFIQTRFLWDNAKPFIFKDGNRSAFLEASNYWYSAGGGDLKFNYNPTARSFGTGATNITFEFNSWTVGSTGSAWTTANVTFDNVTTNWSDSGDVTLLGTWSDEFNTGSLSTSLWNYLVRDDATNRSFGDSYIQINSTAKDLDGATQTAPLMLKNYSGENTTIIVNLSADPTSNSHGGHILFYQNDTYWARAGYYYGGGYKIIIGNETDAATVSYSTTAISATNPLFLKLIKSGTTYTIYYSSNKATWISAGSKTLLWPVSKIGLASFGGTLAVGNIPFIYDYFVTDNFTRKGNLTLKHNATTGNEIKSLKGNFTFPTNSNVTISAYNTSNGTLIQSWQDVTTTNWSQDLGETVKNVTVNVTLYGNISVTSQIQNFTFSSSLIPTAPTSPSGNNVAMNKTITVYGSWYTTPISLSNAVDDNYTTVSSGTGDVYGIHNHNDLNSYIILDLLGRYDLTHLYMKFGYLSQYGVGSVISNLSVSSDAVSWTPLENFSSTSTTEVVSNTSYTTGISNVRYLKSNDYTDIDGQLAWIRWYEIQGYGTLEVPVVLSPTNNIRHTGNSINISWTENASKYHYQLSNNSGFANFTHEGNVTINFTGSLSTVDGVTYYTRVRSNATNDNLEYSTWSTTVQFTENTVPVYSNLTISPTKPSSLNNLTLILNRTDAEGDTVTNYTRWYKNGTLQTALNDTLLVVAAGNTSNGQTWRFEIFGNDTYENSTQVPSNEVVIGSTNSAPTFSSMTISPSTGILGTIITINASGISDDSTQWRVLTYYLATDGAKVYLGNSSWNNTDFIEYTVASPWSDAETRAIYSVIYDDGDGTGINNLTSSSRSQYFVSQVNVVSSGGGGGGGGAIAQATPVLNVSMLPRVSSINLPALAKEQTGQILLQGLVIVGILMISYGIFSKKAKLGTLVTGIIIFGFSIYGLGWIS